MLFCNNCNTAIKESGAKFCYKCGSNDLKTGKSLLRVQRDAEIEEVAQELTIAIENLMPLYKRFNKLYGYYRNQRSRNELSLEDLQEKRKLFPYSIRKL